MLCCFLVYKLLFALQHMVSTFLADAVLLSSLAEVLWKRCTDNGSCTNRLYNMYICVYNNIPCTIFNTSDSTIWIDFSQLHNVT